MRLPLCLLTCDRYEKTKITVETFAEHNDLKRFALLHADDASEDDRIFELVEKHGYETVAASTKRLGQQTMRRKLIKEAAARGFPWILLWENDLETVRPFPWALFEFIQGQPKIYALRLFGAKREREGDGWPCSTINAATRKPMGWEPMEWAPEPAEVGYAHWSTRAFVAKADVLVRLAEHRTAEDAMRADLGGLLTARCVENVVWHMGHGRDQTTPGNLRH